MKSLIKKFIHYAVRNHWLWTILNATIIQTARHLEWERAKFKDESIVDPAATIMSISPDLTVKHGVFKGMKYPESNSIGSMLYPKLLGSYEREIEPVLERICSTEYTEIVDIGCAEGYYTVGIAMRIKTAKVFAYDINEEAIRLCNKMARINNVSERLITGSFCDVNTLKSIPLTKKALIISDCEGYEKELFTKKSAIILAPHDLLIEVHDLIDIEISSYIREHFEATHEIEVYQSIDDINKARQYDYEELKGFDLAARKIILAERRAAIMEWFYMKSRNPYVPC